MTPPGSRTGDPDDDPPPERCRCDGTHWVQVSASYPEKLYPDPPPPPLDASDQDLSDHAVLVELIRVRRAGAANTVYPCKVCTPTTFYA